MEGRERLALALLLAASLMTGACSMVRLDRDKDEIERAFAFVGWSAAVEDREASAGVEVGERALELRVYSPRAESGARLVASNRVAPSAWFGFVLPAGSPYEMVAFRDEDGDRALDDEEWWGSVETGADVAAGSSIRREVRFEARGAQASFEREGGEPTLEGAGIEVALGEIADLTRPQFSSEAGQRGYWQPLTYAREAGLGIFFLEPYDPDRIPILYLNGASGSVQDFRYHFEQVDRSRYQLWFLQYPSSQRLAAFAHTIHRLVQELHERHGFERLVVTAHSMGGLLARGFLIEALASDAPYQPILVTFSTPWGGHKSAASGLRWAPESVPSWHDMVPGSEYLEWLAEQPLGERVPSALFFGYRRGLMPPGTNNDGVVTVPSQLERWAQRDSDHLEGFWESHTSILDSQEALDAYQAFLARQLESP